MIADSYQLILLCAFLGLLSIVLTGLSQRLGAPSLLLFLVIGMLAGEDGFGGIRFNDVGIAFLVGNIALAVILLDGGLRTQVSSFRVGLKPALTLSTLGVAITSGLVGLAAAWVLDWPLMNGLLLGAIVGSTDAAAVFGLLHSAGLELKERSGATLEIESGTNDPMAVFLTVTLLTLLTSSDQGFGVALLVEFVHQMGLGAVMGLAGGWLLQQLLNGMRLSRVLYPLLAVSAGLSVFALTNLWGGSGFLAIYLIGLMLGNRALNDLHDIRWLMDGLAWLSQISMFLILGLLVNPSTLLDVIVPGLVIAGVLMFIARPAAVWLCLAPFRFPARENWFISWVGLKGAVPIILALFPFLSGLKFSETYFEITFFVVLLSLVLQGWTIAPLARGLGLDVPPHPEDQQHLGFALPGEVVMELAAYRIHPGSPAETGRLGNLPLPPGIRLMGVVRKGQILAAEDDLVLAPEDYIVMLVSAHEADELPVLFSELPLPPHLDPGAFFGHFTLRPETCIDDLCDAYGVQVPDELRGLDLDAIIRKRVHHLPVVGDSLRVGDMELVVKKMNRGQVLQVGMKLLSG